MRSRDEAQIETTAVAVTVDRNGKIVRCVIDEVQARLRCVRPHLTPVTTVFPSKNELGAGYGMKRASSIGKEWHEQAAAFARYVTGKTPAEVAGIAVDAAKRPTGRDLLATVTIGIGDFQAALAKAAGQ